jgi:hypothetical protein
MFTLIVGSVFTLLLVAYFIPYLAALGNGHPQRQGIAAVNLLIGWTVFGWLAALMCSFMRRETFESPKGGRIVLLLVLLAILGYLLAFSITVFRPEVPNLFLFSITEPLAATW